MVLSNFLVIGGLRLKGKNRGIKINAVPSSPLVMLLRMEELSWLTTPGIVMPSVIPSI